MTFDGFISYSHAADGRLAPAVQRGLHRLARPWHRRRALWIFRDQTGLSVTPGLWSSIQSALDGSQWFVLMASPEAAGSPWVNKEIEHWIATKSADRILPVVTDGEWAWDPDGGDFAEESSAVPPALRGVFSEEPFFLDLRWARGSEHLSLHHMQFRDAIAQLAAPMHGVSKDELAGEDVRQHRRARRLVSGAAVTLVILALLATVSGLSAVRNGERAKAAAAEALRQQQRADDQRTSAEQSAQEARRQQELAAQEQARAAQASATAEQAKRKAEQQQALADEAAADAERQRRLADRATTRTGEQEQLAQAAAERAQRLQKEADRLSRLARDAAAEAKEQQDKADRQQARAEQQQRIAIARRLMNQATATIVDDPKTALMLGAAAQQLTPDAATRSRLTGLITSTNYAGTIEDAYQAVYGKSGVLAVLGGEGRVALWNVTDPRHPVRTATLPDTAATGGSLALSADGRTLVVVDAQHRATLWDVAHQSHPVRQTMLPYHDVTAVALSGDGATLVVARETRAVIVWDTTDRMHPAAVAIPPGLDLMPLDGLAVNRDGTHVVLDRGSFFPDYDVTDRANPILANYNTGLSASASVMAFSPDGSRLAVGGFDGVVRVYDVASRIPLSPAAAQTSGEGQPSEDEEELAVPWPADDLAREHSFVVRGLTGEVRSVAFSADGSTLAAGDQAGVTKVWGVRGVDAGDPIATVQMPGPINTVSIDPAKGLVATADATGTATLWKIGSPVAVERLGGWTGKTGEVVATVFTPDGRSLIAAGRKGKAYWWDTTNPARPVRGADFILRQGEVVAATFSPDRRRVATVGGPRSTLMVGDVARRSRTVKLLDLPGYAVDSGMLAFDSDGRTLAVATGPTTVELWDVAATARPTLLAKLSGAGLGGKVAFSPDGKTLATAAANTPTVKLWDLTRRSAPVQLAVLGGRTDPVVSLAFDSFGRSLASDSLEGLVIIWDVRDRARPRRLANFAAPGEIVTFKAFSSDGRTLATQNLERGSASHYDVVLWDITGPDGPIRLAAVRTFDAAFRPDGNTLLAFGTGDFELFTYKKLNRLRANPAKFACGVTGRGLTAAEWATFIPELPYRRTCVG